MIRQLELTMEKSQKEEDSTLRSELEKKHLNEQVEFRKAMAEQQAQLRRSLIGDASITNDDTAHDQRALEKYEAQKKLEEEKRLHNIKLKKKTVAGQLDAEMNNKYGDYDDLLRRKKEDMEKMRDQTEELAQRLAERKERAKNRPKIEGLSKEEQEALMNSYKSQLEMLDSAYAAEQRRQMLAMKQKADQRRIRSQKAKELKEKLEKERAKKLGSSGNAKSGLTGLFQRRATLHMDKEAENSELMRRLRAWKLKKKEYEQEQHRKRIAETNVTLGDASIKMMIIKLNQIENLMKDLNKQTKKVHGRIDDGMERKGTRSSARQNAFAALGGRDRGASVVSRGSMGPSAAGGSSKGSRR